MIWTNLIKIFFTTVGVTKTRVFLYKSCQNISTIVKSGADGVAMISELANSSNLKNLIKKLKSHYE